MGTRGAGTRIWWRSFLNESLKNRVASVFSQRMHKAPAEAGAKCEGRLAQNEASSSSITSLSIVSMINFVLVSNGRKFFAKKDATAILPS
jgi:hypothetical protein